MLVARRSRLTRYADTDHASGLFASSFSAAALAPLEGQGTLGSEGVPCGKVIGGNGLFSYCPWWLYGQQARFNITDPDMVILGQKGKGKSTGAQTYLRRQHGFGRYIRIVDPAKPPNATDPVGEYTGLARDLGGETVALRRGGGVTLNPLEDPGTRHALLRSIAAAAMRRGLSESEPALLNIALDSCGARPTLPMVLDRLLSPTPRMAARLALTVGDFFERAHLAASALHTLCEGDLSGLFDGETSDGIDFGNRCLHLDLSGLADMESLGVLMTCAISFLQSRIDQQYGMLRSRGVEPKSILAVDEAWRVLSLEGVSEWFQHQRKNARKDGQQNIAIMHGFRDMDAVGDDGRRVTKLAAGLLGDTQTFVLYRMPHSDAKRAQELLNLSDREFEIVTGELERGDALWVIGPMLRFPVHMYASPDDLQVTSPDRAMAC